MQTAMKEGRVTSHELVLQYFARIATYEHTLHAALAVSQEALKEADLRDRERAQGRVRGPLHGIPVALKDNIQTTTMPTTGGALAFERLVPRDEATLARNLREAGAVIIAKTGMTELANWVADDPTPMPTNYNALGGFGFNPYDPRRDPRDATFDGRPALANRRIELRHRHGRQLLGRECRYRNVRVDSQSFKSEHARRHQADRGPNQPLRSDSDHGRSRYAGADGERRDRRGHHARRARRRVAGSARPGDRTVRPCARDEQGRLSAVSPCRRSQGRPHRDSARVLLRPRGTARRTRAARRAVRRADRCDGRGNHRPQAAGRHRRRPGQYPERGGCRFLEATSCGGAFARAPTWPKARMPTAQSA